MTRKPPPPMDSVTLRAMVKARKSLSKANEDENLGAVVFESYSDNGWVYDDGSLNFWAMFRHFWKQQGGSPGIEKRKSSEPLKFDKGGIREQRATKKVGAKGAIGGVRAYNPKTKQEEPVQAIWDGKRWVYNTHYNETAERWEFD